MLCKEWLLIAERNSQLGASLNIDYAAGAIKPREAAEVPNGWDVNRQSLRIAMKRTNSFAHASITRPPSRFSLNLNGTVP